MFNGASNLAEGVDKAFVFIFATAFVFIVGITAFMIWTVIKYRRSKGKEAAQFTGSVKLEIIWTVVPSILVLIMFWYGWMGFREMRRVPKDALKITAIGRMWEWEFDYGDGKISKKLVIPVNQPIRLDLVSKDVNHSLFIPAFRVKEDVVPGYNNFLWFTPTYMGTYDVFCTEYCGLLHSAMISTTEVVSKEEFDTWLANLEATGDKPDHPGLAVLKANACLACHSIEGAKLVGPAFNGTFGTIRTVTDAQGKTRNLLIDAAYIKRSIYEPNTEVVDGYAKGLMQAYDQTISEEQVQQIVEYLETIKQN
ncbi:MAG: cytochrome c oxidase subunit II [Bacteroidota bacterium]|nr:MAG: cytochrome c oxidase subunit II [Bacteroidota bacterium]